MAQITLNEGLAWLKTLKKRHDELIALRNENAHRERRFDPAKNYGEAAGSARSSGRKPMKRTWITPTVPETDSL